MVSLMPSEKVINLEPSNFETIDAAIYDWINGLSLHTTTNDGWKETPIIWITAERAFQIKNKKETRTVESDALVFPMISVERTGIAKAEADKRPIPAHLFPNKDYRGGTFSFTKKINQSKTRNFANAEMLRANYGQVNFPKKDAFGRKIENQRIVYHSYTIPLPIYYEIKYDINLRTDYQQQMNELMQPLMTYTGNINQFIIRKGGHFYEAFIDKTLTMTNNASNLGEEEKSYETTVTITVLGYLMGDGKNQITPKVTIRENPVKLRFQRERVMLGDINEYSIKDGEEKEPFRP